MRSDKFSRINSPFVRHSSLSLSLSFSSPIAFARSRKIARLMAVHLVPACRPLRGLDVDAAA